MYYYHMHFYTAFLFSWPVCAAPCRSSRAASSAKKTQGGEFACNSVHTVVARCTCVTSVLDIMSVLARSAILRWLGALSLSPSLGPQASQSRSRSRQWKLGFTLRLLRQPILALFESPPSSTTPRLLLRRDKTRLLRFFSSPSSTAPRLLRRFFHNSFFDDSFFDVAESEELVLWCQLLFFVDTLVRTVSIYKASWAWGKQSNCSWTQLAEQGPWARRSDHIDVSCLEIWEERKEPGRDRVMLFWLLCKWFT